MDESHPACMKYTTANGCGNLIEQNKTMFSVSNLIAFCLFCRERKLAKCTVPNKIIYLASVFEIITYRIPNGCALLAYLFYFN